MDLKGKIISVTVQTVEKKQVPFFILPQQLSQLAEKKKVNVSFDSKFNDLNYATTVSAPEFQTFYKHCLVNQIVNALDIEYYVKNSLFYDVLHRHLFQMAVSVDTYSFSLLCQVKSRAVDGVLYCSDKCKEKYINFVIHPEQEFTFEKD